MNIKSFKELKFTQKPVTHAGSPCPLVQWSYNSQELNEKREKKKKNKESKKVERGSSLRTLKTAGVDEGSGIKDQKIRKE